MTSQKRGIWASQNPLSESANLQGTVLVLQELKIPYLKPPQVLPILPLASLLQQKNL